MIDARGLSCPIPVVLVQKAVRAENPDELDVLLDAECSVENVTRFAANRGYAVSVETAGSEYRLHLKKTP